jgi:hypothetical protein
VKDRDGFFFLFFPRNHLSGVPVTAQASNSVCEDEACRSLSFNF